MADSPQAQQDAPTRIWIQPIESSLSGVGPIWFTRKTGDDDVEYVREGEAWQPIETAPRDARSLLIYCPESGDVYQAYRFDGDNQWRMFNSGGRIIYQQPTLWQQLPNPPEWAKSRDKGEKS